MQSRPCSRSPSRDPELSSRAASSHLIETQEAFILPSSPPLLPRLLLALHPPVPVLCLLCCALPVRLVYLSQTPPPATSSVCSAPSPSPPHVLLSSTQLLVSEPLNTCAENLQPVLVQLDRLCALERKEIGYIFSTPR